MRSKPPLSRAASLLPRELSLLELLAIVVRGDARVDLLPRSLRQIATEEELALLAVDVGAADGAGARDVSTRMRLRIQASIEIGLRISRALQTHRAPPLPDPDAVAAWGARLLTLDHEELWMLALDGKASLRAARCVAAGGLHGVSVALADPLRAALRAGASAFLLVHNHPSGDPTPSEEDRRFTLRVSEAAAIIGVPLVDHVVVAREGHVSMLERGFIAGTTPTAPAESSDGTCSRNHIAGAGTC